MEICGWAIISYGRNKYTKGSKRLLDMGSVKIPVAVVLVGSGFAPYIAFSIFGAVADRLSLRKIIQYKLG